MSTHKAIIAKIHVTPHPDENVHSLAVGLVCNETIICGKNTETGTLGLYFPCELQLSTEFAVANDLIRRKDADGKPAGGLFDDNRRVRAQKIRGVKSNGFWCPLSFLEKLGGDISTLKEGDMIDTWNNKSVCRKHITRQTKSQINKAKQKKRSPYSYIFPEHKDTEQFKYHINNIKEGDELIITLKMEGTSQRVARNYQSRPLKWWERIINKFTKVDNREMVQLNGTRRVTLNNNPNRANGWHPDDLRDNVMAKIAPYLEDHMHVYLEVVGWESPDSPIMGTHHTSKLKDKEVSKLYPEEIVFSYGLTKGQFGIYVYRISHVLPSGKEIDMLWDDVKKWCDSHNINHVKELRRGVFDGDYESLLKEVERFSDGPDPIDKRHPREGVCIRVNSNKWQCYKNKGFVYKCLAGIIKDDPNYVDAEEVEAL